MLTISSSILLPTLPSATLFYSTPGILLFSPMHGLAESFLHSICKLCLVPSLYDDMLFLLCTLPSSLPPPTSHIAGPFLHFLFCRRVLFIYFTSVYLCFSILVHKPHFSVVTWSLLSSVLLYNYQKLDRNRSRRKTLKLLLQSVYPSHTKIR